MRYLVISDIHANLEALEVVLAQDDGWDHVLVLGDLVGYGADPNPVIDRLRALPSATFLRGNHDKVASGVEGPDRFNHLAQEAIGWTARTLTPDNRRWLAALRQGPMTVDDFAEICHGTPFDEDAYVFDDLDALRAIRSSQRPLCLVGHTHIPSGFKLTAEFESVGPIRGPRTDLTFDWDARYLVNCGAVGQPRDGDPRAAYGLLDCEARTLSVRRVAYDVAAAQGKILAAGLPEALARRLGAGR